MSKIDYHLLWEPKARSVIDQAVHLEAVKRYGFASIEQLVAGPAWLNESSFVPRNGEYKINDNTVYVRIAYHPCSDNTRRELDLYFAATCNAEFGVALSIISFETYRDAYDLYEQRLYEEDNYGNSKYFQPRRMTESGVAH